MIALKQNDYHYWDGYFKGLGVKELLEMPDSYWELLTSDFIWHGLNRLKVQDYEDYVQYSDDNTIHSLKSEFLSMLKDFNYQGEKEVSLYRSIKVNNTEEIDFENLGVCWTPVAKNLFYLERNVISDEDYKKYLIRFSGNTSKDNIDWIESLYLYLNYKGYEKELRVLDPLKITLKGYLYIDMETFDIESNGDCEDIQIKDMESFKSFYL